MHKLFLTDTDIGYNDLCPCKVSSGGFARLEKPNHLSKLFHKFDKEI